MLKEERNDVLTYTLDDFPFHLLRLGNARYESNNKPKSRPMFYGIQDTFVEIDGELRKYIVEMRSMSGETFYSFQNNFNFAVQKILSSEEELAKHNKQQQPRKVDYVKNPPIKISVWSSEDQRKRTTKSVDFIDK